MAELGAAMAAHHPRVLTLDLSRNSLGDDGAARFADAVLLGGGGAVLLGGGAAARITFAQSHPPPPLPSLTALSLAYNGIGAAGASALARALDANATLRFLDLSHNPLGDDGVRALADALARLSWCQLLRELDVSAPPAGAAVSAAAQKALRLAARRRNGFRLVVRPRGDVASCLGCLKV